MHNLPRAALSAQPAGPGAGLHPPGALAEQLAQRAAPAVDGWIDAIGALVQEAGSLQDIRDGLARLLPDMSLDEYAAAMGQALAAAQLAGRYEVLQEAAGLGHG